MKHARLILGIVGAVGAMQVTAVACTCDLPNPHQTVAQQVRQARADARAVFSGRVLRITKAAYFLKVEFSVETVWKGSLPSKVVISTGRGGGDCGYRFEVGERYLVYATGANNVRLGTNICQRTASFTASAADLAELGKPKRPRR